MAGEVRDVSEKKIVQFVDASGGGEGPWKVYVDGKLVIEGLSSDQMDVSATSLKPVWAALNIEINFRWSGDSTP